MDVNISDILAKFVLNSQIEDIPELARGHAKMGILDWLGVVMVGLKEEEAIKK